MHGSYGVEMLGWWSLGKYKGSLTVRDKLGLGDVL
jgi:hypothetical protein